MLINMLDDTIELLTKQMIEQEFKDRELDKVQMITLSKVDLYKFSIKLVKLIQKTERSS